MSNVPTYHAKAWAARWRDLDVIELAVLLPGRDTKLNLAMSKPTAQATLRDLLQTRDDGDDAHSFTLPDVGIVSLSRELALGLLEAFIRLLERGIWTQPRAGYHSDNIRLSVGPNVALVTPGPRWV